MASDLDYRRMFEVSPNAYMVLDRELRFVAANATYQHETGTTLEQLLGKYVFDLFPNDPNDASNVPARMLQRSFEKVLASGERDHLALIPYRVPKEVDGKIIEEDRFWSATHTPVLDGDGRVAFILQHTVDVTELQRLAAAAAGKNAPSTDHVAETGVLSRARAVQEQNAKLDSERDFLRSLYEQAPGFMCFLEGNELVFTLANAAYMRLIGREGNIVGKRLRDVLPEVVSQGFVELLERVATSGEAYVGMDVAITLQDEEKVVDFIYQPVRDADGKTRGVFVQGHDVTARKVAEREREAALRAANAFSEELVEQSKAVEESLIRANARIAELETKLAAR